MKYDEAVINAFLEQQSKLFREPVAETYEEAEEYLAGVDAAVFDDVKKLLEYMDRLGYDVTGVPEEDVIDEAEVFEVSDGRYLFVEG